MIEIGVLLRQVLFAIAPSDEMLDLISFFSLAFFHAAGRGRSYHHQGDPLKTHDSPPVRLQRHNFFLSSIAPFAPILDLRL